MSASSSAYTSSIAARKLPSSTVNGVRSSCETSAIRLLRSVSAFCKSAAILLKVSARSINSRLPRAGTRASRSPSPTRRAAFARSLTGALITRAITTPPTRPTTTENTAKLSRRRAISAGGGSLSNGCPWEDPASIGGRPSESGSRMPRNCTKNTNNSTPAIIKLRRTQSLFKHGLLPGDTPLRTPSGYTSDRRGRARACGAGCGCACRAPDPSPHRHSPSPSRTDRRG